MAIERFHMNLLKPILLVALFCGACKSEPNWLPEFRSFIEEVNRDLEEIASSFAPESSPQFAYIGFSRLDKVMDRVLRQLHALIQKYPQLFDDTAIMARHLWPQIAQLKKNMSNVITLGTHWYQKLKNQPEIHVLVKGIQKKIREADRLTQKKD